MLINGSLFLNLLFSSIVPLKAKGFAPHPIEFHDFQGFYFTPGSTQLPTSDPMLKFQWYLINDGQIIEGLSGKPGADIGWDPTTDADFKPPILAILDSGFDLLHEDFDANKLWINSGEAGIDAFGRDKSKNGIDDDQNGYIDDLHGWNFAENNSDVQDTHSHGTHISGPILARSDNAIGIASISPNIQVMLIKIFSGAHPTGDANQIAKAIRYAVDHGATVLSNSYGSPSYAKGVKQAIEYARDQDVLFVSAAGNTRKNIDKVPDYPSSYGVENQIVVAASNHQDRIAAFSNFGKNTVSIMAPGAFMFSTYLGNSYRFSSGTSQATPIVATVVALLRGRFPELNYLEVKEKLLESGDFRPNLAKYSHSSKRVHYLNAINLRVGEPPMVYDFSRWYSEAFYLESRHPYRHNQDMRFPISLPEAEKFRVHFKKFATYGDDFLRVLNGNQIIEQINGNMGQNFWSDVIEGDTAEFYFSTNDLIWDYGFTIDRVQWLPKQ